MSFHQRSTTNEDKAALPASAPPSGSSILTHPATQILLLFCSLVLLMTWVEERMYWPWMLSAYLMALALYFFETARQPAGPHPSWQDYLFPKEVWLHPSAVQDYTLSIINFFLIINVLAPLSLHPEFLAGAVAKLMAFSSLARASGEPPMTALVTYTALSLLLADFFYYWSHRLTHKIPVLWEFHKVHHSAEVMTPVTVYRMHPLDLWINQSARTLGMGIANGFFLYFYPTLQTALTVAGVDAGILAAAIAAANLRHSHIWISFGPAIERVLLSPALHQIHHSDNPRHFDRNYGSLLSVWDWMFGSLYLPKGREKIIFGVGNRQTGPVYHSVWDMYARPVKKFMEWVTGRPKMK